MTKAMARNLAAYLLSKLAQDPPEAFAETLARMLDEQRARPVLLPTTDTELDAAAEAAFIASCAKQFPQLHPGSPAAQPMRPIYISGFKAAFKAFVGPT